LTRGPFSRHIAPVDATARDEACSRREAYTTERAAALSGVPQSTVRWWARHEILVPGVSAARTKLWSYVDLFALRVIYWLRQRKTENLRSESPGIDIRAVRRALAQVRTLSIPVSSRVVDSNGNLGLKDQDGVDSVRGRLVRDDVLDIVAPFSTREGRASCEVARGHEHGSCWQRVRESGSQRWIRSSS
jgi:DNA-binding transcriptional MerR regulator